LLQRNHLHYANIKFNHIDLSYTQYYEKTATATNITICCLFCSFLPLSFFFQDNNIHSHTAGTFSSHGKPWEQAAIVIFLIAAVISSTWEVNLASLPEAAGSAPSFAFFLKAIAATLPPHHQQLWKLCPTFSYLSASSSASQLLHLHPQQL